MKSNSKFSLLLEEFISSARQPMSFGSLPVEPKDPQLPVIPMDAWVKQDNCLKKRYEFRKNSHKIDFVIQILEYETEVGHNAEVHITEDDVTLTLQTKDINQITELDREYARHADELFKDVVYGF